MKVVRKKRAGNEMFPCWQRSLSPQGLSWNYCMWVEMWVIGRENEAGEDQHDLGLKGLVRGYGKEFVLPEFPCFTIP